MKTRIFLFFIIATNIFADPPDNWHVNPEEFENVFTVTAKLIAPNDIEIDTTITVAAFINGECRGIQNLAFTNDEWLLFLMVYGNNLDQEIHFDYHVNALDSVFGIEEIITFTPGGSVGTPDDPILFHDNNLEISDFMFLSPGNISLSPAYPNPFNPVTYIDFETSEYSSVTIEIFNSKGQLVKTLIDGNRYIGTGTVVWNGTNAAGLLLSSGVYIYSMRVKSIESNNIFTDTKKMILLK